jgi:WD40 repeat protein
MIKQFFLFFIAFCCSILNVIAQQDTVVNFEQNLPGHTNAVETVAYSKDGKFLISGSWDNTARLYTVDTSGGITFSKSFTGHFAAVTAVAINYQSTMVATGSKDFTVRVYDIVTGKLLFVSRDHKESISNLLFDPAGMVLFSSSHDGSIRLYDVVNFENNKAEKALQFGTKINDFILSTAKGAFLVASSKSVIEQITLKKNVTKSFVGHTGPVNCIDMSPNKKMLASGSDDKSIIIWDMATATVLKKLTGHAWKVTSVQFSADGKYLVSTCNTGEIKLWNLETGKCMTNIQPKGTNARQASFNANETRIAVASLQTGGSYGVSIYKTPIRFIPFVKKQMIKGKNGKMVPAPNSGQPQEDWAWSDDAEGNKSNDKSGNTGDGSTKTEKPKTLPKKKN